MPLNFRQQQILNAIIDQFINTAEPVGSNTILVNYYLKVSSATIRNDMAILEKENLIYQPHISAGRVPTSAGYRIYLDTFDETEKIELKAKKYIEQIKKDYFKQKAQEKIYDCVALIANAISNVSFATIPGERRTFYLGLSNILKQPEFIREPLQASHVVEILEESDRFIGTLNELGIDDDIRIFIGEENLIQKIESCSIIATQYEHEGYKGIMGIIGPMRMNYPFNKVVLREVKKMLA
ncbi:hypothetical protein A2335_01825 [Candidatus Peregrinibacteria bacterium RIFOXYB2_FULL_32_7]|nr:MAG: hypothetical protein A2335_01825 [Candidatus Peregrinibacteria bacterium RIFOXYB2_FULL_32_7]